MDLSTTGGSTLQSLPEGGFLGQVSFDSFNQTGDHQSPERTSDRASDRASARSSARSSDATPSPLAFTGAGSRTPEDRRHFDDGADDGAVDRAADRAVDGVFDVVHEAWSSPHPTAGRILSEITIHFHWRDYLLRLRAKSRFRERAITPFSVDE